MKIELEADALNALFEIIHTSTPTKHTVGEIVGITNKIREDVQKQIQEKQGGGEAPEQDVQHLEVEKP